MDIINHYSAYPTARTTAAGRTGAKTPDARSASPGMFQESVKEFNELDPSAKLYNGSATRAALSDTEVAVLANKYDIRNMSDTEYDAFLDDLESMGAISRYEKTQELGYKGVRYLDLNAGEMKDGVRMMSAWSAPLGPGNSAPVFDRRDANGDIFKWLTDRSQYRPTYDYEDPVQRKAQKDIGKLYDSLVGIAGRMASRQADSAEEARKADLVRQLADGNSSFYANMRNMLKAQAQKTREDDEEQAIIDALGAVLDALSGKKDAAGKKESVNKSASDLTQKIGERISKLKADDPERIKLESMLKRLQEVGIYVDLSDTDDWWQSEDETFETLTQLLTRRQAEQASAEHPKEDEVNQTE